MAGQIGQRHGIHLLGDRLVAFVARGGEVEVQVPKQDGEASPRARLPRLFDVH